MTRVGIILVFVAAAAGCRRKSDLFCERNPDQCTDGSTEGQMCGMCMAPTLVCNTDTNLCVECVKNTDCATTTPVCDEHACRACRAHADCVDSETCLPDGSCAAATDVAYIVNPGGADNATCDKATPCATMTAALAT